MGHKAGNYMVGTDMFYRDLYGLRESFEKILLENDILFDLKPTVFVFSAHQGYIFHFFDVAEDIYDPTVYGYAEAEGEIKRDYDRFSNFLLDL